MTETVLQRPTLRRASGGEPGPRGEADIGFQQLSELIGQPGIEIVGSLPPEIQSVTVFSAGISVASRDREAARAFVAYLASPGATDAKLRYGMEPA